MPTKAPTTERMKTVVTYKLENAPKVKDTSTGYLFQPNRATLTDFGDRCNIVLTNPYIRSAHPFPLKARFTVHGYDNAVPAPDWLIQLLDYFEG